jgi:hypothetical protein
VSLHTAIVARSRFQRALIRQHHHPNDRGAADDLLPYSFLHGVLRRYANGTLWFLRVVCGTKVEWRGRENSRPDPHRRLQAPIAVDVC